MASEEGMQKGEKKAKATRRQSLTCSVREEEKSPRALWMMREDKHVGLPHLERRCLSLGCRGRLALSDRPSIRPLAGESLLLRLASRFLTITLLSRERLWAG